MYFYRCKAFASSTAGGSRFSAKECVRITRVNVTDLSDLDTPAGKILKRGKLNNIMKAKVRQT